MFETNQLFVKKESVFGSSIYIIDDFYKNPKDIVSFLLKSPTNIHKQDQYPSYNHVYFYDDRHCIIVDELNPVISWIESLVSQKFKDFGTNAHLFTNYQTWVDNEFNCWETNYWYPHLDFGYTAIIYLDETNCGTNLYSCKNENELQRIAGCNEHTEPWRSKQDWECIHRIEPKFNRMVIFEANKFYHGLEFKPNLFKERRLNQVMFFEDVNGTI